MPLALRLLLPPPSLLPWASGALVAGSVGWGGRVRSARRLGPAGLDAVPAGPLRRRRSGPGLPALVAPAAGGVLTWALVGGVVGAALACGVAGALAHRAVRAAGGLDRELRLRTKGAWPFAAGLLAECLSSGATPTAALAALVDSAPEPVATLLRPVVAELRLGAPAARAWAPLLDDPSTASMARALVRTAQTGAPAAPALRLFANDLMRERRSRAAAAVASLGVRAALPLGLCFLPAFLLLGVVPCVWGLVVPVLGSG